MPNGVDVLRVASVPMGMAVSARLGAVPSLGCVKWGFIANRIKKTESNRKHFQSGFKKNLPLT